MPNRPSITKASILLYLPLVDLVNTSPWITCQSFLILRMEMTMFSWSSIDSRRWPLCRPARRISQQQPLLKSSLNECGFTLGSHSLYYQIMANRFLSTFWSNLWSMLDTKLTKSATFHPQTDGQIEEIGRASCRERVSSPV